MAINMTDVFKMEDEYENLASAKVAQPIGGGKDEKYYLHQTPPELAKALIATIPLKAGDSVLEPFKGEGAFYDNLPTFVDKDWTEIEEGRDYKTWIDDVDWVISNPPFKLGDRVRGDNAFWVLLKHYTQYAKTGIAFLGNDYCLSTLTPVRMKLLNEMGWYLQGYKVCSVKAWRGRYFFMTFTKTPNPNIGFISGNW